MNETMNDPAIEEPRRTAIIIAAAQILGFDDEPLSCLTDEALELEIDSLLPYYSFGFDRDDRTPREKMIYLMHCLGGSDDDFDDMGHDLDHAQGTTDPCEDHPDSPCGVCCLGNDDLDHPF